MNERTKADVEPVRGTTGSWVKERELEDPDDVLIAAEQRKRELAAERHHQYEKSEEGDE